MYLPPHIKQSAFFRINHQQLFLCVWWGKFKREGVRTREGRIHGFRIVLESVRSCSVARDFDDRQIIVLLIIVKNMSYHFMGLKNRFWKHICDIKIISRFFHKKIRIFTRWYVVWPIGRKPWVFLLGFRRIKVPKIVLSIYTIRINRVRL